MYSSNLPPGSTNLSPVRIRQCGSSPSQSSLPARRWRSSYEELSHTFATGMRCSGVIRPTLQNPPCPAQARSASTFHFLPAEGHLLLRHLCAQSFLQLFGLQELRASSRRPAGHGTSHLSVQGTGCRWRGRRVAPAQLSSAIVSYSSHHAGEER